MDGRHPWLIASLAAHAGLLALAACVVPGGPVRMALQRDERVRTQVAASLEQTAQRQMTRELRALEQIRDALADSTGAAGVQESDKDAAASRDPAMRARALARQIEAARRHARAAEMARLLKIPQAEADKRVRAESIRPPVPPAAMPPAVQVNQLLQQAKAALAERRAQLLAQQQGVAVKSQAAPPQAGIKSGQGGPGPGGGKTPAAGGMGAGQGRMSGQGGQGGRAGGSGSVQNSAALGSTLDALASGLAMGPPGALTGSSIDMASSAFSDQRGYGHYLKPPPVDGAAVRAGRGRTLGAGGPFANRVFLDTWYVIGPFEGAGHDSQNAVYPPERGIDLDAVYFGKNHLPVRWTFQQDVRYPSVPLPRAENAVYYAYTEVEVDRDRDLWVWIGGDDDTKLWFNDRLVWLSGDGDDKPWYRQAFSTLDEMRTLNLTEGQRRLHFHRGRNSILMKLYNGVNLMFYSVVLSAS